MTELPSSETLATLVSNVTETMFSMSFSLADGMEAHSPHAPAWRMAVLPIKGKRPLTVAIASDRAAGSALGSAMFSCPIADVDAQMVDDSLTELVNIVAGQIKSLMGLDQALGLPTILSDDDLGRVAHGWHSATMQSGETQLLVWVAINETKGGAQ